LDIAIVSMLALNAIYAYRESKWLVMSATAASTLLVIDAWFDVTSASGVREISEAIIMAIFIELPMACLTFLIALRVIKHEQAKLTKHQNSHS
jgi:hypothetical protein